MVAGALATAAKKRRFRKMPIAEAALLMTASVELASAADLAATAIAPKKKRGRPPAYIHRGDHFCYRLDCQICAEAERAAAARREQRAVRAGCRCGHKDCDCAKWEAIYRAKFADPAYYQTRVLTPQSSARGW